jgi:hypothetical protein
MADVPESFWDNLLDYIQEGTVVPVIGSELVTVREGEQDVPLDSWLARRLAADLGLPTEKLPEGFALNEVVALHLRNRGEREELYPQIHRMLKKATLPPPEPLKALASIPRLDLFVSLTFDSLLADALDTAQQIAYAPNTIQDLPSPKAELRQRVVFHLLGKASSSPDYVICDEDLLEFLHGLQDKQRQPKTLFDELRGNHLLFLGCNFGDWLARFFLRTARSLQLSQRRRRWDMLVGDRIAHDPGLVLFLESFSSDARMVPLTAADFATELARRWHATHPPAAIAEPKSSGMETAIKTVPHGAIFVSYASEDRESAGRLAEGLRAAGLEVWFDKNALQMGDDWARSIRSGIERCSLFLPVISQSSLSEENRRRYFWREWNDADDISRGYAAGEAFIVPIVIDDGIRIDRVSLPGSFQKAQGTSLPSGTVTPSVAERLKELVRDFHRRQRAA